MAPDLDVIAFWCCESVLADEQEVASSSGLKTYTVRWEPAPPGEPYSMWWVCECKGFQYRHECKHVPQAEAKHCGWDAFMHGGSPVESEQGPRCPRCGEGVTAQRYAV